METKSDFGKGFKNGLENDRSSHDYDSPGHSYKPIWLGSLSGQHSASRGDDNLFLLSKPFSVEIVCSSRDLNIQVHSCKQSSGGMILIAASSYS